MERDIDSLEVSLEHPGVLSSLPQDDVDDLEEENAQREADEWNELSAEW
jgi:hypothetical protein